MCIVQLYVHSIASLYYMLLKKIYKCIYKYKSTPSILVHGEAAVATSVYVCLLPLYTLTSQLLIFMSFCGGLRAYSVSV